MKLFNLNVRNSSAFVKLGITEKNHVIVNFADKPETRYVYFDVPTEKIAGLREALKSGGSVGGYFFKNIRHDKSIRYEVR